jgi:hypothetical protein
MSRWALLLAAEALELAKSECFLLTILKFMKLTVIVLSEE